MMTQGFERKDAFQLWAIVNVRMRIAHIFVTLVLLRFCGTVVQCYCGIVILCYSDSVVM